MERELEHVAEWLRQKADAQAGRGDAAAIDISTLRDWARTCDSAAHELRFRDCDDDGEA